MSNEATFGQKCLRLFSSRIAGVLTPLPKQPIWEWLNENIIVPLIVGSRLPEALDTVVMPQWRGLLEKYGDRRTRFFTLCKSARGGGTLFFGICLVQVFALFCRYLPNFLRRVLPRSRDATCSMKLNETRSLGVVPIDALRFNCRSVSWLLDCRQ